MNEITLDLRDKSDDELRGLWASIERARSLMLSEPGAVFFAALLNGIAGELRRRETGGQGETEPLVIHVPLEVADFAARLQRGLVAACTDADLTDKGHTL